MIADTTTTKKRTLKKKKNKILFQQPDFSKFDVSTGDKIAMTEDEAKQRMLANLEASSEAKRSRTSPFSKEETIKDAATGGSLSYLVGRALNFKDSKKFKFLTSARKHGALGLAAAGAAAALSAHKQKSEYNKQQGAREFLVGKDTGRSKVYKKYLKRKYGIDGE